MSPPRPRKPSTPLSRATPKERTSSRLLRWSFGPPVGQCARRTSKSRTAQLPANSQAVYSGDIIAGKEEHAMPRRKRQPEQPPPSPPNWLVILEPAEGGSLDALAA